MSLALGAVHWFNGDGFQSAMIRDDEQRMAPGGAGAFATTDWSAVLQAGQSPSPQVAVALEKLCRSYWYPLYLYARRRGYAPHDAEDQTQEFFALLLERNWFAQARPEKGRFRSYLLAACRT